MAELGNDISNKIYEAKVAEIIAKRATPDCDKETREKWIKAKYMLKAFINPHALKSNEDSTQEVNKTHWTVRRLRRRARNSSLKKQTAKESKDKDEKDEDTSQELPRDDSESSILEACGLTSSGSTTTVSKTTNENVINAEKLVFGGTLSKHHVASIEVNDAI